MQQELLKYCIDDCKVLLTAVLIFRNIIIDKTYDTIENDDGTLTEFKFNYDPFREAITIPSLAQKLYRSFFIPNWTIEAYTDSKNTIQESETNGFIT